MYLQREFRGKSKGMSTQHPACTQCTLTYQLSWLHLHRKIKGHVYLATVQCTLTYQLSWLYLHRKIKGHVYFGTMQRTLNISCMALFMEGNRSALILWSNTIQYSKHIIAFKHLGPVIGWKLEVKRIRDDTNTQSYFLGSILYSVNNNLLHICFILYKISRFLVRCTRKLLSMKYNLILV